MSPRKGRSIELFFHDGDPDGMVTATIPFQWTGHVLRVPRGKIDEGLKEPEANQPGIYILSGNSTEGPNLYVGETDEIRKRIKQHIQEGKKDWWDDAIFVTAIGEPLNKAHARYLEYQVHTKALNVGVANVDNAKTTTESPLSKAAQAHMDGFLDNLEMILKALGYHFLDDRTNRSELLKVSEAERNDRVEFVFAVKKSGVAARAVREGGHFIVLQESTAKKEWQSPESHLSYSALHESLIKQGVLVPDGDVLRFAADYRFSSPSAAGAVIAGRTVRGTTDWKVADTGQSYQQWEQAQFPKEEDA